MSYPDIIVGLSDGTLLVAEQYLGGRLVDRWLIHKAYNDEFKYIEEGEHIIVRRAYKTIESAAKIH